MKIHHRTIALLLLGVLGSWGADSTQQLSPNIMAAAERGDAASQYQLARAYLRGQGVPENPAKAFDLMKAAADQGDADAIGGLGYFYSAGVVTAKDEAQAGEWFRKGAEKGSARARLNLGRFILDGKLAAAGDLQKTREEGLRWVTLAADQGLPEAAFAYGNMLYFGDYGMEKDFRNAEKYYKIAAQAGVVEAQNDLGVIYEQGMAGQIDLESARQWYLKAALRGSVKAQANLGRVLNLIAEGKVHVEGIAWLLIASAQGEVTAQKELDNAAGGINEEEMKAARAKQQELWKLIQK